MCVCLSIYIPSYSNMYPFIYIVLARSSKRRNSSSKLSYVHEQVEFQIGKLKKLLSSEGRFQFLFLFFMSG